MKAKRPHASLPLSPDKPVPSGKKARFEDPSPPEAEISSPTNDVDMSEGEADAEDQPLPATDNGDLSSEGYVDAEDEPLNGGSTSGGSEFRTSPQSATNHGPESSPSTSVIQDPASIEHESIHDQDNASSGKTFTIIRDRAVGTLPTSWPAEAGGLTEDICDLKTLKQLMTSNKLNQEHKAMWVSLVQTIVHEPDRNSVLVFLQNTLSGDATLPDSPGNHLGNPGRTQISRSAWAVTDSIETYGKGKKRWSAAHFVDLALWVGGPAAGNQAARALKVFGIWNPSGNFDPAFAVPPIRRCVDREVILHKIWPDEIDGEELLLWANHSQARPDHPFREFREAHLYLLRECIGEDLELFSRLARNFAQVGDASNRIISRAYFDSTLAPILLQHFDSEVDLELAYSAAVDCQGKTIDRVPVTKHAMQIRMPPAQPTPPNQNAWKHDKSAHMQPFSRPPIFHPPGFNAGGGGDNEDDEEPDHPQTEKPIKPEPGVADNVAPSYQAPGYQAPRHQTQGYQEVTKRRGKRFWTAEETQNCRNVIIETVAEKYKQGDFTDIWELIMTRLVTKHQFTRSQGALYSRWYEKLRYLPEYQETVRLLDSRYHHNHGGRTDKNGEREASQNNTASDEESEESADSHVEDSSQGPSQGSLGDEAEEDATDVQDSDQAPVHEGQPPTRVQARTERRLQNGVITRSMSSPDSRVREKQITNKFYQHSRDVSSDVIARFIRRLQRPRLHHHWQQVLEHRLKKGMKASGSQDDPPFPLIEPLDDSPPPKTSRRPPKIDDPILKQNVQDIKHDIDSFNEFAES